MRGEVNPANRLSWGFWCEQCYQISSEEVMWSAISSSEAPPVTRIKWTDHSSSSPDSCSPFWSVIPLTSQGTNPLPVTSWQLPIFLGRRKFVITKIPKICAFHYLTTDHFQVQTYSSSFSSHISPSLHVSFSSPSILNHCPNKVIEPRFLTRGLLEKIHFLRRELLLDF